MSNPITVASSSTTEGITSGRRRIGTPGIHSKCWCRESIIVLIFRSRPNPYRRYLSLENDNHVFKWVDEAFTDEIQQLDYQFRMLEEEIQLLKATIGSEDSFVPAADVRDFMDTLEFHVIQIVQRIGDVDLSIPRTS
ncbi:hypothetical protein N665_1431s0002 [Sinapis alba]|nr:hypothetical protein N665_1431s0002 [Sinapis alba]